MRTPILSLVLWAALAWGGVAQAACSRAIHVPVAAIGFSVVVKGSVVSGVFPEFLQDLSAKAACQFSWTVVPRARLEAMFEQGRADMILAATHSDKRDQAGRFIPLVYSRAALVSLDFLQRAPLHSMQQLIERKDLRVTLVRGYDYGEAYQDLIKQLTAQGRLYLEPDPIAVARLLVAGVADVTIVPPSVMLNAAQNDARVASMLGHIRAEPLDELPWIKSGVYLSTKSLSPADRQHLEQVLIQAGKSGALFQAFARVFPPEMLAASTRPLQ